MSTRATVHFQQGGKTEAIIYRHYDGDELADDLETFFKEVKKQAPNDAKFDDPTYLAAKFIVWQAAQYAEDGHPLKFTGVGIYMEDPGDEEYHYLVQCDNDKTPKIKREEV